MDKHLHINPNTYMKQVVVRLIENNTIPPKSLPISLDSP